jgi:hypothetical protein
MTVSATNTGFFESAYNSSVTAISNVAKAVVSAASFTRAKVAALAATILASKPLTCAVAVGILIGAGALVYHLHGRIKKGNEVKDAKKVSDAMAELIKDKVKTPDTLSRNNDLMSPPPLPPSTPVSVTKSQAPIAPKKNTQQNFANIEEPPKDSIVEDPLQIVPILSVTPPIEPPVVAPTLQVEIQKEDDSVEEDDEGDKFYDANTSPELKAIKSIKEKGIEVAVVDEDFENNLNNEIVEGSKNPDPNAPQTAQQNAIPTLKEEVTTDIAAASKVLYETFSGIAISVSNGAKQIYTATNSGPSFGSFFPDILPSNYL